MKQLNKTLEVFLVKKAPALPKNIKEILVKFAPWLAIIGVVLSIPALLTLFGLSTIRGGFSLAALFLVATAVLEALAVPGLMKRKIVGWNFLYYGVWLSAVYSLLSYDLIGLVVGLVISLYLLFQVKSYYK